MHRVFQLIASLLEVGIALLLCFAFLLSIIWIGRLGVSGGMLLFIVVVLLLAFAAIYWLFMKFTQFVARRPEERS